MKNIYIITAASAFDFKNKEITIGGVQVYIKDLSMLCVANGFNCEILAIDCNKCSNTEFFYLENKVKVSRHHYGKSIGKTIFQKAFDVLFNQYNTKDSIFIIDTDQRDIKSKSNHVIHIQHGVAFDIPGYMISGICGKFKFLQFINKLLRCIKNIMRVNNVKNTICVDYNFFNWYRTIGTIRNYNKFEVIPNYASSYISKNELSEKLSNPRRIKKILFARRFVNYRGTLLFANVVKHLLDENYNIEVVFAGQGPLCETIKQMFENDARVKFASFDSKESVQFHKKFDIAVVPTIYSEGTSLSLNEAMAAGCFPICTYIGGMSNMIISGFNGISIYPDEDSLYDALKAAINMPAEKFNRVVSNAYYSSLEGFSKERWDKAWLCIINKLLV